MQADMRLEPGIMAIVVGYVTDPRNLGRVVELVRFLKAYDSFDGGYVPKDYWVVKGENLGWMRAGVLVVANEAIIRPEFLMPIRPEADPLEFTQQLEEKV